MIAFRRSLSSVRPLSPYVWSIAALGALGAAFSGAQPTGSHAADVFWCALFGGGLTIAATHARRFSWLLLVGVTVCAADGAALIVAGLAVGLAAVATTRRRRPAILGAAIGALSASALLRLDLGWFHGDSALLTLVAIAPVLLSGRNVARSKVRHVVRVGAGVLGGLCVLFTLAFAVAVFRAQSDVEAGIADSRASLSAIRDGRTDDARPQLDRAVRSLDRAKSLMNSVLAVPARAVPLVGQHARALGVLTADGTALAETARSSIDVAGYDQLRYESGRFDLARIAAAQQPLTAAAAAATTAEQHLDELDGGWLLPPLRSRLDDYQEEVTRASAEASRAAEVVAVAPGMLGADGDRRYFIAFVTPAEMRGSGGFIGSYGELTAIDGRVRLSRSGPIRDLITAAPEGIRTLTGPADYLGRYGRFAPEDHFQDLTLSPNFPSVAQAIEELYPQSGGSRLDGVLQVDPYGLAALLELTGPIQVDGIPEPLTSANAADVLLRDQYSLFGRDAEQDDALDDAARETFEQLTEGSLPSPRALVDVLDPMVDQGRFKFHSIRPLEQKLVADVGLAWPLPARAGQDTLAVTTQNNGNSKIDVFLQREIDYRVAIDPDTKTIEATAVVTLTNSAPPGGLPAPVLNNNRGLPLGTSRVWLSLYTPLLLDDVKIGNFELDFDREKEGGYHVYGQFLNLAPGQTISVTFALRGTTETPESYRFEYFPQPMVNPDEVKVSVEMGGAIRPSEGLDLRTDGASSQFVGDQIRRFRFDRSE